MTIIATPPRGIYPALATAFKSDGSLDLERTGALASWLIESGVHGLAPLGSTGEFYTLSREEREAVSACVIEAAAGRAPVIVGANASSTAEVIQYCKIARKQGASGVLLAPPYYALPTRRELLQHFTKVASATDLPITLYNYPGRTGVDLDLDIVVKLAAIETVVAIKESSGDATRIASIREMCEGRIAVLCGCDTLALESFAAGAEGWIGGGANFLPREHIELYELMVLQADLVNGRKLAASILPVLRQLEESGAYTQCVKAGLNIIGHPAGPPRAPLMPADEEQSRSLKRAIETLQSQPR